MSERLPDDQFDPARLLMRPLPRDAEGFVRIFEAKLGPSFGPWAGKAFGELTINDLEGIRRWTQVRQRHLEGLG